MPVFEVRGDLLDYLLDHSSTVTASPAAVALLQELRDGWWPDGPPIEPTLVVNDLVWRAGDIFRRRGSSLEIWALVLEVETLGLRCIGLLNRAPKLWTARLDYRLGVNGLRVATLTRKGSDGQILPPAIIKI